MIKNCDLMAGDVVIEKWRNGQLLLTQHERNRMTNAGAALWAQLRIGAGVAPTHIAVGTGSNNPSDLDTALQAEVARVLAIRTVAGSTSKFTVTLNPGVATGTLRESGIFNASSAGVMTNRVVFSAPVVKEPTELIIIGWALVTKNQ